MAQIGVFVQAVEAQPSTSTAYDVATAFITHFSDWGPPNTAVQFESFSAAAAGIGTPNGSANVYAGRTTTCATAFDALETFFGEGGYRCFFSRVVGPSPVKATLALSPTAALTVTAKYAGNGGNGIYVAVQNNTTNYVITLQDASGNVLAQSPALASLAAGVTWASTTAYVTATSSGSTLPSTAAATPLAGGADDHASATLTNWQNALAGFYTTLGPGQVLAPGVVTTAHSGGALAVNGIWSALGTHALNNNRIALCDMDDGTGASTLVGDMSGIGASGVAGYSGFWAGNVSIPGIAAGTARSVPPSAAIAGLCARVDSNNQGNVNQPAAGPSYPLQYATANYTAVSGSGGVAYSSTDLSTLNDAGINTFAALLGQFLNYGFVSAVPYATDVIYWQLNHGRTRMSIVADSQIAGAPFVFSQIDGQGSDQLGLQTALQGVLMSYYNRGALYGASPTDAFTVDAGNDINPPTSLQAGVLNALLRVRLSPFAEQVYINITAVPMTQAVTAA